MRRLAVLPVLRVFTVVCLSAALLSIAGAAEKSRSRERSKRPISNPKFDPTAEEIGLFEGMENGSLEVQVIPQNAKGGNVLIENTTDQPLTVKLPDAVVGVQVLKQFGGEFGGG
ncbi:MAG: hypothetical protein ACREJB_15145, partial [Planctomycetaceae bacterium]